ncbi:thiamine diphosphokinase [Sporolactobacillus vineae]|uniref:thiamine diphosphokinase n=1 Tax=Sporolactobacillus vineae TaxID=444463 RepID=UPI00028806C9|nr:thiamine diphosphokinase [Sporolactobacillus vineae]
MKLAIVAGGPEARIPDLTAPEYHDFDWIGADRGTFVLLKSGIKPKHAFGDFDSVHGPEKNAVFHSGTELRTFQPEKDQTDLEIAVDWAVGKKPELLLIFGATGGRIDHELAAVQILLRVARAGIRCALIDTLNRVTLLMPGTYHVSNDPDYHYLSFLALSEKVEGLTLEGVKYPLKNAGLPVGSSLCISNEADAATFSVSLRSGCLLMMQCSDA